MGAQDFHPSTGSRIYLRSSSRRKKFITGSSWKSPPYATLVVRGRGAAEYRWHFNLPVAMVEAHRTTKVAKILPQCVKIYEIFRSIFSVCREVTAASRRRKRRETKINFPTSANLASENLFSFIHSAFARAKRSASGEGRVGTISIRVRLPLPYRLLTRREILVVNLENCAPSVSLTPPGPHFLSIIRIIHHRVSSHFPRHEKDFSPRKECLFR